MQPGRSLKKSKTGQALGDAFYGRSEVLEGVLVFLPVLARKIASSLSGSGRAQLVVLCSVVEEKFSDAGLPAGGLGSTVLSLAQEELTDQ